MHVRTASVSENGYE